MVISWDHLLHQLALPPLVLLPWAPTITWAIQEVEPTHHWGWIALKVEEGEGRAWVSFFSAFSGTFY